MVRESAIDVYINIFKKIKDVLLEHDLEYVWKQFDTERKRLDYYVESESFPFFGEPRIISSYWYPFRPLAGLYYGLKPSDRKRLTPGHFTQVSWFKDVHIDWWVLDALRISYEGRVSDMVNDVDKRAVELGLAGP